MTPLLKWAGGKRWQAPIVDILYKRCNAPRLVELFCGGAAVAFEVQPKAALLNDVNPHLINFYQHVKAGTLTTPLNDNVEEIFYAARSLFNALIKTPAGISSSEAASLFFYLNRTCFNGLCRFNKAGGFTTPYGKYAKVSYERDWPAYAKQFEGWQLTNRDFRFVPLEANDFVYADPPYDDGFTDYSSGGFSWEDQARLARWLSGHPGPVVLVNKATQRIDDLYRSLGFNVYYLEAPRNISCDGNRAPVKEIFARRNL